MMLAFQAVLFCHLLLHSVHSAIVNVALNQPAWQSSTDYGWIASRANDGNRTNVEDMNANSCSTTNISRHFAWWQVDLGHSYVISHILLIPRNWVGGPGRLAGFSIYVSSFQKQTWITSELCFHDSNPSLETANERRINCTNGIRGQYVVVYNKRPPDNAVPDFTYSSSAILELCEVIVPVDLVHCADSVCSVCYTGWYGKRCENSCENCVGGCFKENGTCKQKSCTAGYYGPKCTEICRSTNCYNNECDFSSGQCQRCIDGYFGPLCNQACSTNCAVDRSCDFSTGKCNHCPYGKYGTSCEIDCPVNCSTCEDDTICSICNTGFYGTICSRACPGCGGNGSCSKFNGQCTSLTCKPKYYGYTAMCDRNCPSSCGGDGSCLLNNQNQISCNQGCANGFMGEQCDRSCPTNCGGDGACSREGGACSAGCNPGWNGTKCELECQFPKFGLSCTKDCGHCKNKSCDHINGTCKQGCEAGWLPSQCDIRISKVIDDPSNVSGAAIGSSVGAIVVLITIVVIVVVVLFRRRRHEERPSDTSIYMSGCDNSASEDHVYTSMQNSGDVLAYQHEGNVSSKQLGNNEIKEDYCNVTDENATYCNTVLSN